MSVASGACFLHLAERKMYMIYNVAKGWRICVALLLVSASLLTGCTIHIGPAIDQQTEQVTHPSEPEPPTEKPTESPTEKPTQPTEPDPDVSLNSFRQAMVETPQIFAVAYFGYHETMDSDAPVDPFEAMRSQAPQLCEDLPFLMNIPEDRIIGEGGELYCIVPLDANAEVTVSRGTFDENSREYLYEVPLYAEKTGDPILLFCNNAGWEPDRQIYISGESGDAIWYPQLDVNSCAMQVYDDNGQELFKDFSPYQEMLRAQYESLKDQEWVLPTVDHLTGGTWESFGGYVGDREVFYRVTFQEDTLTVNWNDGLDENGYEYPDAKWELEEKDGYAVLTIDFAEFAGILRYNLLYSEVLDYLYVAMDVRQDDLQLGLEPLSRYLVRPEAPEPMEMVGTWEMAWTEVEGDKNPADPGSCIIEISQAGEDRYTIDFIDNERPNRSFYGQEMVVLSEALYWNCGNSEWIAAVMYTDDLGTGYNLTLLPDGTLLVQQLWKVDGAQMVAYECFTRK